MTNWSTVIGGWQQGGSYELIITYTFTKDIYDGSSVYLQGDYSHILNVTSK